MKSPVQVCALGVSLLTIGCGQTTANLTGTPVPAPVYPFQKTLSVNWITQFGASNLYSPPSGQSGPPVEVLTAIAVDPAGNAIAVGYTLGAFPGYSNPGQVAENYVVKISAAGKIIWLRQFGTGKGDFLQNVALDSTGAIYAAGTTLGSLPGFTNAPNTLEAAVFKLDGNGNLLWQQQFAPGASVYGLAVDTAGDLFTGGIYSEQGKNTQDLFFAKLRATDGTLVWQQALGTGATDYLDGIAADTNGTLYATGVTSGPFPGEANGASTPFLIELGSSSGQLQWQQTFTNLPSGNFVNPSSITVAPSGAIVVGGAYTTGYFIQGFGAGPDAKAFIAEYSPHDGSPLWETSLSTGAGDQVTSVATDAAGNVLGAGYTNGLFASSFTQPSQNVFVAKLGSDGTAMSVDQFGNGPLVNGTVPLGPQIAAGANGYFYVGGPTQGAYPGFSNPSQSVQMFVAQVADD